MAGLLSFSCANGDRGWIVPLERSRRIVRGLPGIGPFAAPELDQAAPRQPHRGVGRPTGGDDLVVDLERYVAIDRQRTGETEGADAADSVAGQTQHVLGAEHARPATKGCLSLLVVEAGIAAGHQ